MALNLYRKKLDVASNKRKAMEQPTEEVKEDKEVNPPGDSPQGEAGEFVSYIFACRNIVHMMHLNTKSFAAHKALGSYYDEVIPIIDSIAETFQGISGKVITGYVDFPLAKYENADPVTYLKEVRDYVQEDRYDAFPKGPIQNELDNLENLLNTTIYKLEQLK
jgi:hypothetical protein